MRVRVGCEFVHHVSVPTHAVLQVEPRLDVGVAIAEESWANDPVVASTRYVDGFGNLCRRLTIPPGRSTLRYNAVVERNRDIDPADFGAVELSPAMLPDETLVFTLPSRLCPSDELFGVGWDLFGAEAPGWSRVQTICDWVHREIVFGYGSSTSVTTAADVLAQRQGVCRDFAHLFVTLCRVFGIPARYAFGYLPDVDVDVEYVPMDFCAWAEVFLGDRWWTFDPRNNQRRVGRVLIGRGRDALDVAMVTTFGQTELESMTVWADEVAA